jgi:hypothetical protein
MLKLLERNKKSNDFMNSEYLLNFEAAGHLSDNIDIFKVVTNKYIYDLKLPYKIKYDTNYGNIHLYPVNINDICKQYNIDMKYFNSDIKDNNILPFNDSYKSEIGKYLPINDYSHIY